MLWLPVWILYYVFDLVCSKETDQRWKQFARLQLAARALLKPKELEALKVKTISRNLSEEWPCSNSADFAHFSD